MATDRYTRAAGRWRLPKDAEREATLGELNEGVRKMLRVPKGSSRVVSHVWSEDLRRIRRLIGAPKNAPPSLVVQFLISAFSGFSKHNLLNLMFASTFPRFTRKMYDVLIHGRANARS